MLTASLVFSYSLLKSLLFIHLRTQAFTKLIARHVSRVSVCFCAHKTYACMCVYICTHICTQAFIWPQGQRDSALGKWPSTFLHCERGCH